MKNESKTLLILLLASVIVVTMIFFSLPKPEKKLKMINANEQTTYILALEKQDDKDILKLKSEIKEVMIKNKKYILDGSINESYPHIFFKSTEDIEVIKQDLSKFGRLETIKDDGAELF